MSRSNAVVNMEADAVVGVFLEAEARGDRGVLSELRRGVAFESVFGAVGDMHSHMSEDERTDADERALFVGQCYGRVRYHRRVGDFGVSMRLLMQDTGSNGVKHLASVIFQSRTFKSAREPLFRMVRWMASNATPIDFKVLYSDLMLWDEKIGRRWASTFYSK
jgi:hypothetical protein